jgi:branched-chain amino acid transport system permease protein
MSLRRINLRGRTLLRGPERAGASLVPVIALVLVAYFAGGQLSPYNQDLITTILLLVIAASAWNLLGGVAGQISLGVAVFYGSGAYATVLLLSKTGVGTLPAIVLSMIVAGIVAALLSPPLLRLRGISFTIGTLAASLAALAWVDNWHWVGATGGINLPLDAAPSVLAIYRYAVLGAGVTLAVVILVVNSRFGMRLMAIRDAESAAEGLGVTVFAHRAGALVLSSALLGLAGSLTALQQINIDPSSTFDPSLTVAALLYAVVGGIGTVSGPAVGAIVVYYLLERNLQSSGAASLIIEGGLLIAIVRFAPRGLVPTIVDLGRWTARHAFAGRGQPTEIGEGEAGSASAEPGASAPPRVA